MAVDKEAKAHVFLQKSSMNLVESNLYSKENHFFFFKTILPSPILFSLLALLGNKTRPTRGSAFNPVAICHAQYYNMIVSQIIPHIEKY